MIRRRGSTHYAEKLGHGRRRFRCYSRDCARRSCGIHAADANPSPVPTGCAVACNGNAYSAESLFTPDGEIDLTLWEFHYDQRSFQIRWMSERARDEFTPSPRSVKPAKQATQQFETVGGDGLSNRAFRA